MTYLLNTINKYTLRIRKYKKSLFKYYLMNTVVNSTPSHKFRQFYYRHYGMKIGENTTIRRNVLITHPNRIEIGNNTLIGNNCHFQGQGRIIVGNNVNFASYSKIWTGSHDINCPDFSASFEPVFIEDYVWVSAGATILQGMSIGEGAVVMAGAIVTKNVEPFSIVGGIPAKKVGERNRNLRYNLKYQPLFH
jgi:acetyltransferase-like isoleucine patch superfamily enzyme